MSIEQFVGLATFIILVGQTFSTVISYRIRLDVADEFTALRERVARLETAFGFQPEGFTRGGRRAQSTE